MMIWEQLGVILLAWGIYWKINSPYSFLFMLAGTMCILAQMVKDQQDDDEQ